MKIKTLRQKIQQSEGKWLIFSPQYENYIKDLLCYQFGDYEILYTEDTTIDESYELFYTWFYNWKTANGVALEKTALTLTADYNPLENMNIKENFQSVGSGTDVTVDGTKGDYTSANKTNVYDSSTLKDTDQTKVTFDNKPQTKTTLTKNRTVEVDGEEMTGTNSSVWARQKHGNIGVQSLQKYATEEIELRQRNVLREWILKFVTEYCFLVGDNI